MAKIADVAQRSLPWIAGAGLAASHTLLSSNCTVPRNGQCSTCGSCVLVLGTLVGWALWKKQQGVTLADGEYNDMVKEWKINNTRL